jgi:hypothetical protein
MAPTSVNDPVAALAGHVTRLRAALLRYRLSPEHAGCQARSGVREVDMRCHLCRIADDVLGEHLP